MFLIDTRDFFRSCCYRFCFLHGGLQEDSKSLLFLGFGGRGECERIIYHVVFCFFVFFFLEILSTNAFVERAFYIA